MWALAAEHGSSADYRSFIAAARELPDDRKLEIWLDRNSLLSRGHQSAENFMAKVFVKLETRLNSVMAKPVNRAFEELRKLGAEIARAYE